MFIDLSWTDLNSVATKLEIYRGDAELDRANLPGSPLVTLTAGETSYRDTNNVLLGHTYYYVFVNSTATDRVVSQNYRVTAVTRRGPGPQTLKQGDNALGYFGSIQAGEFLNGSEFVDLCGIRAFAPSLAVINPFPLWHKYVRNNKVILLPEGPIANSVSWTQLYTAGMVNGTDDNGPIGVIPAVKQGAKITVGKDVFRVRLIRGMTDTYTDVVAAVSYPNEFNDLVYPMCHTVPADQRLENLYTNGRPNLVIIGSGVTSAMVIAQEQAALNSTCNTRGSSTSADDAASDLTNNISARSTTSVGNVTTALTWFPLLELIEG